ncbi:hypothetical protein [Nocardia sp. CA-145437]|uniref:hypothetical protein n=1 Tax=Nocardia sp. CA-145437 TaxID=3239980 RepID=UPI003D9910ED
MATVLNTLTVSTVAVGAFAATTTTAFAQPIFTPEPGGIIKIESAPGEWWKCGLYSADPPTVVGPPPVVNYAPGSWPSPSGQLPTGDPAAPPLPDFATPPAYAKFAPGTTVVADCMSQYLPVFWLETIHTQE